MGNVVSHEHTLMKTNRTDNNFKLDMGVQANVFSEAMVIAWF